MVHQPLPTLPPGPGDASLSAVLRDSAPWTAQRTNKTTVDRTRKSEWNGVGLMGGGNNGKDKKNKPQATVVNQLD